MVETVFSRKEIGNSRAVPVITFGDRGESTADLSANRLNTDTD